MSVIDEVERLAKAGKPREGIAYLEQAAGQGDAEAMFILANWRLWGLYGPKDLAATHDLLVKAEAAGWREAALLRATLIGNGTGCPSDPDRARSMVEPLAADDPGVAEQLRLLDQMPAAPDFREESLSPDADIRLARGFLTAEECGYLMRKAEPLLRPSMIFDDVTKQPRPDPVRTSSGMNFDPTNEDLVVHAINRRIAALTASDVRAGEPLHILSYAPGQEFRPHLDAVPGASNQREWTALIYLNEGYEGGVTVFSELGVEVLGRPGDCLIFRVIDDRGNTDQRLRHAGQPVTAGAKWLASRWIRQRPYEAEVMRA
jgi:prolyl 4-hydroxylase